MKTNKIGKIFAGVVFAGLLASCNQEDYLVYDTDFSGIYFTKASISYSFGVTENEIREHVIDVPVRIMGVPTEAVRNFAFEIMPDSTAENTHDGVQYRLGTPQIPADSIDGFIPVTVLRDGLCVITFDNAIAQPEWYNAQGGKVWLEKDLGAWHPLKLIKMVEYFHELDTIQNGRYHETYEKMVALYGENLEHIHYSDPYEYKTTMKKYIYKPMYNYFNDAANEPEIHGLYPDFPLPSDFPNPYPDETE